MDDDPKKPEDDGFSEEFEATFDEESPFGDEALFAEEPVAEPELHEPVAEEAPKPRTRSKKPPPAPAQTLAVSTSAIPVTLTVEVGRLKMNVEQLLHLSPGNLLEMDVRPEQGIHLLINGVRVGKGELVKVGDVLGVRVTQLG